MEITKADDAVIMQMDNEVILLEDDGKCVLCDRSFAENEVVKLAFEKRIGNDGQIKCSLAGLLSLALGYQLNATEAHSTLICNDCSNTAMEFEKLNQSLGEIRYRILNAYICTIQHYKSANTALESILKNTHFDDKAKIELNKHILSADNVAEVVNSYTVDDKEKEELLNISDNTTASDDISICNSTKSTTTISNSYPVPVKGIKTLTPAFERQGKTYSCLLCTPVEFLAIDAFMKHMHKNHNLRFYSCDFCSMVFLQRNELDFHKCTNVKLKCPICKKTFSIYRRFSEHMSTHKAANKKFDYTECQESYSSLNLHTGKELYKCEECLKCFASKYILQTHIKIHGKRPRTYYCEKCDKAYFTQQILDQHKKIHARKKCICKLCLQSFVSRKKLISHNKIKHCQRRKLSCLKCGKAFRQVSHLRRHEGMHAREEPFKSDQCTMTFVDVSNLASTVNLSQINDYSMESLNSNSVEIAAMPEIITNELEAEADVDDNDSVATCINEEIIKFEIDETQPELIELYE